jgi:hypothetical protein
VISNFQTGEDSGGSDVEGLARRAWRLRVRSQLRDPWTLLAAAVGGGVTWALENQVWLSVGVAAGMLGVAGVASVFSDRELEPARAAPLRRGTEQARLLKALDGYLEDLRQVRGSNRLPEQLKDSAIEALVAADGARTSAARVAEALDSLDNAIHRAQSLAGADALSPGTRSTLQRMSERRADLLRRLAAALTEVQEVHANLLELSASVDLSTGVTDLTEITAVNQRLDALRSSFSVLESDALVAVPRPSP